MFKLMNYTALFLFLFLLGSVLTEIKDYKRGGK